VSDTRQLIVHPLYEGKDEDGIVYGPKVKSWAGWPAEAVDELRAMNKRGDLSFVYLRNIFTCPGCGDFIDNRGSTACRYHGGLLCDDCMVAEALGA
jgi:hypothetical protein